jgi:hypothetical protein
MVIKPNEAKGGFTMDHTTFMINVFCLIDDWLKGKRLRQRGPQPKLADSEVLTIEIMGAFLGINTDKGIYTYFRRHYGDWFPMLREVHRTTFVRQSANLWAVKDQFWRYMLRHIRFDPAISLVDSFPVPVCRFARAYRCQRMRGMAAFGYDEVARQTFYGFRAHLRVCWPGVIVGLDLAPANVHELPVAETLLDGAFGWALGDRNYWSPKVAERLHNQGLHLLAPYKSSKRETKPWPLWLVQKRRRIETVIGQLVDRFHAKRVWARDTWHFWSRWLRKVLSHTIAILFCQQQGISPLRFSELLIN